MSDGITADPNSLALAGQQFGATSLQLYEIGTTLAATLAGLGDFLGAGDFATSFRPKYEGPARAWMDQTGVASGQGLPGVADTITNWAQVYTEAQQSEAGAAQQFSTGLG